MANDNLLTVGEAAKVLGCSVRTVKARVESRRLRSSLVCGRRMFRREWLDAYIDAGGDDATAVKLQAAARPRLTPIPNHLRV